MVRILDPSQNQKSITLRPYALLFTVTVGLLLLLSIVQCAESQPLNEDADYIVVSDLAEKDAYYKAIKRLANHRKGQVLAFEPDKLEDLLLKLKKHKPHYVALVTRPETIHTNFIRQFLMMSTRVDEDPFSDFAWGVITAVSAEDAVRFVENMIRAEKEGLPKEVMNSYVSVKCKATKKTAPGWLHQAGYTQSDLCFGIENSPDDLTEFIDKHIKDLEGCGLVRMTGCGDPERIWLFNDQRNMDKSKHWDYDPKKVGSNPDKEMQWIDAEKIRTLNLYPAVLTSGVCHGGALKKVFVENDIISTFGRTKKVEVYDMPKQMSLGLAYLSSGLTAAILPVGPNHGWRTCVETGYIFQTGAPLGEVMKIGHDELVLAYNGPIELGLHVPNSHEDADPDINAIMRGGAANRVLYGDPAYAPFKKLHNGSIKVSPLFKKNEQSYQVDCFITAPFSYADNRTAQWVDQFTHHQSRIFFSIELPSDLSKQGVHKVSLMNPPDDPEENYEVRWAEEQYRGRHKLHIMALSTKPANESFLCSEKGRKHSFLLKKANRPEERMSVSPKTGTANMALNQLWHYEWKNWRFIDVLDFIEELWVNRKGKNGEKCPKFCFEGDAALKREILVTLKLESEPLKSGLDRLCRKLGLKYQTDDTGWLITFSEI